MFYTFVQNNTYGKFIGPHVVIVEAASANEANAKAESTTNVVYFDGCQEGEDCYCCGDRWSRVDDYEGTTLPELWGEKVTDRSGYGATYSVRVIALNGIVVDYPGTR